MRAVIRDLDAFLCRVYGVFPFSEDPASILRLQITGAPHPLFLAGLQINKQDPVLMLHFWNEHIPPIPVPGPTLSWAVHFQRLLIQSFQAVAQQICLDPRLLRVRAVGGVFPLLSFDGSAAGFHLMHRLGFTVYPYHRTLGNFGEFWENFYSWLLLWTYNPASLPSHQMFKLHRMEIWMSKDEFINRYGLSQSKLD